MCLRPPKFFANYAAIFNVGQLWGPPRSINLAILNDRSFSFESRSWDLLGVLFQAKPVGGFWKVEILDFMGFFLAKMVFLDVYEIFDQKRTQVVDWWWNIHATPVYPKFFFQVLAGIACLEFVGRPKSLFRNAKPTSTSRQAWRCRCCERHQRVDRSRSHEPATTFTTCYR